MNINNIEIHNLSKSWNETLILSVLYREKLHGYQLALELENRSNGLFKFKHGTLYPILHKLENDGLISGVWKQEGQKRKRKYYKLTAKGKKRVSAQLAEWRELCNLFFNIVQEIEQ